jgi:hypothetical protein
VEISNEGKITVNGKEVDQIMINGKPFLIRMGKLPFRIFLQILLKIFSLPQQKQRKRNSAAKQQNLKIPPSISILMKRKIKG